MLAPPLFAVPPQAEPATHEIRAFARHRSRDRASPRSAIAVGLPPCPLSRPTATPLAARGKKERDRLFCLQKSFGCCTTLVPRDAKIGSVSSFWMTVFAPYIEDSAIVLTGLKETNDDDACIIFRLDHLKRTSLSLAARSGQPPHAALSPQRAPAFPASA